MNIYSMESVVRSYCLSFPDEFTNGYGSTLVNQQGKTYLDFLSGCGSLNYGHNHPGMCKDLVDYMMSNGLAMSLDLHSSAKTKFMETFFSLILAPRDLDYRMQFPGPTGANSIEAAIKIARKVTGRMNVIAFTNGFHGCSLGALSLTGNSHHRKSSAPLLTGVSRMPYESYLGDDTDTADVLEKMLNDPSSGVDMPAAIVLEVIQGEGGLNYISPDWAKKVCGIARKHQILIIVDEIQSGCGRSGHFFAFERLGIKPDIITLAKSLSGFGLPMSMVLLRPQYDIWEPGEHNGTFRGNNHAYVTATTALNEFWQDTTLQQAVRKKEQYVATRLNFLSEQYDCKVKGYGLMQGLDVLNDEHCKKIKQYCYEKGLIIESSGPCNEVLKLMPPLTIEDHELEQGLNIIEEAVRSIFKRNVGAHHYNNETELLVNS